MRFDRTLNTLLAGGLLAALAVGCASPAKVVKPETEVSDAVAGRDQAVTPASTPAPQAPTAAPQEACTVSRVHFAFDSAQLDGETRVELKSAAACLQQRQPGQVVIEGHCDERGTTAYNLALGNRRAAAVRDYLKDLGVGGDLSTISFGKEFPLVRGSGEEAWSQNRRAELRLPGDQRSDGRAVATR